VQVSGSSPASSENNVDCGPASDGCQSLLSFWAFSVDPDPSIFETGGHPPNHEHSLFFVAPHVAQMIRLPCATLPRSLFFLSLVFF